jgi:hypothetical protein
MRRNVRSSTFPNHPSRLTSGEPGFSRAEFCTVMRDIGDSRVEGLPERGQDHANGDRGATCDGGLAPFEWRADPMR